MQQSSIQDDRKQTTRVKATWVVAILFAATVAGRSEAAAPAGAKGDVVGAEFRDRVEPVLVQYCYDCHADGADKGEVAFDTFASEDALFGDHELWLKVLKNVRAGIMPPARKSQPTAEEKAALEQWIKYRAFGIDPQNPDPGRVTLRRLNRVEYANTIRDLMGVEFKAAEEFPPDDTGYGFDNIGDVLTTSPLLLEKYMQAAETIVTQAVPATSRNVREATIPGAAFRQGDGRGRGGQSGGNGGTGGNRRESRTFSFYQPAAASYVHWVDQSGSYEFEIELAVGGSFNFDPGRARVTLKLDDRELVSREFGWENDKRYTFQFAEKWEPGERRFSFELEPLKPKPIAVSAPTTRPGERRTAEDETSVNMRIAAVRVRGPIEPDKWDRPRNFDRFFTKDAPTDPAERRAYAREVLARFATKAFRRPVDDRTVDRLTTIAEETYGLPDKTFEQGVARAMVAVLASPRFLFRVESVAEGDASAPSAPVDEYALASRLSYFLWSSMPDEELLRLAGRGELRRNLSEQVKRMLADPRSDALVRNFTGQWLQVRDVDGISIDERTVLARDRGIDKELQRLQDEFRALRAKREAETRKLIEAGQTVETERQTSPEEQEIRNRLRQFRGGLTVQLDTALRQAMRRESEMFFEYVLREDRSVLDFLDSDYTFLNEKLAKHYGIPGVTGEEMRRVTLPPDSPRGGVLTQGSVLVVTSNPTRTSPVKRGVFVLENILGTPTPPPPEAVPELEAVENEIKGKDPTLREVLAVHQSQPQCSSCHKRMDPLGLGLENFNALGMWRDSERKQPIDSAGKLATGESFGGVRELKKILRDNRRTDFYRCLTEKLLTYALGRGMEHYDVEAVDRIVEQLEKEGGRPSVLLAGIVESAPFQKRRNLPAAAPPAPAQPGQAQPASAQPVQAAANEGVQRAEGS